MTRPVMAPCPGDVSRWELWSVHTFKAFGREWIIPAGYLTDGASVPSVLGLAWAVTARKEDSRVMRAALHHDFFCDRQPEGTDYASAAALFRDELLADGLPGWRAGIMYRAVLMGGPRWGEKPQSDWRDRQGDHSDEAGDQ